MLDLCTTEFVHRITPFPAAALQTDLSQRLSQSLRCTRQSRRESGTTAQRRGNPK